MLSRTLAAVAAAMLVAVPTIAIAVTEPKVVDLLFESRHLEQLKQGSEITYSFERKVSDERLLGAGFKNDIKLGVAKVNGQGEREIVFKVFSGEQARDPSTFPDLTINPLFLWYLNRSVDNYSQVVGGQEQYLKYQFKRAFRESASVEAVQVPFGGKTIDAYKVTIMPFYGDPSASKMEGFERSQFVVLVSNDAPGFFLKLDTLIESTSATAPKLEEHISLVGPGETP